MENRNHKQVLIVSKGIREVLANALSPKWAPRLHTDSSSPAVRADQAWFNTNPDRKYYVRPAMEGDDLAGEAETLVVRKEDAGFRHMPMPPDFEIPDKAEFAAVMYELMRQLYEKVACENGIGIVESVEFDVDIYSELVAIQRIGRWLA